jgi:predicted metal-dependent enzyme (double-stranded beta helix superfamily)
MYGFSDFVTDLELITSVRSMDEDKIRQIHRKMRLLLSDPSFLSDEARAPNLERYARHLLHKDKHDRFVVVSLVWLPGQGTPVHDHSTWGVAGIVSNELRIVNYVRLDDGQKPGYAELREASAVAAGPGTVLYVLPPNDEIHVLENASDRTTITLHVYGKEITRFNVFDVEAKSYKPSEVSYDTAV